MMVISKATVQVGFWAGFLNILGGVAYLGVVAVFMVGDLDAIQAPGLPAAQFASVILFTGTIALLALWAALHQSAPEDKKIFTLISLACVLLTTAMSGLNRWAHLTVIRQAVAAGLTDGIDWLTPYGAHSVMFAAEILGWGWWYGLALITMAPLFLGGSTRLEKIIAGSLIASGVCCLLGAGGLLYPASGLMLAGILGWGVGSLWIVSLITVWFGRLWKTDAAAAKG